MKNLIALILLVFVSTQAMAAELRLLSGETATIQANQSTRVSCEGASNGGGNSNCSHAVQGLTALMEACKTNYSANFCIDKHWPAFKKDYPSCVYGALSVCIEACKTSYSANYCADKCMK